LTDCFKRWHPKTTSHLAAGEDNLLNGPQLVAETPSQADADAMFAKALPNSNEAVKRMVIYKQDYISMDLKI
jgi:hypothetical protein